MSDSARRIPAQAWPVGDFLVEEMRARGWSIDDLVSRMGSVTDHDRAVDKLVIEFSIYCADEPGLLLGDTLARQLALAFGTSPEFFLNLDKAWRDWRAAQPAAVADGGHS